VQATGHAGEVEVVVTDWGSDTPLCDALDLSPAAAQLTSFVSVPADTVRALQHDSPFAEVIALNAAARRARGAYIGRIDQDTLVGRRFLTMFFDMVANASQTGTPLAMGFSNIKYVNYRFAVRCPPLSAVEWYIRCFGRRITRENARSPVPIYDAAVGIWLVRRDVWHECGGYDERMIYMNGMESNMVRRLLPNHTMVDLGARCDYDFFHLEHYYPWTVRKSSTYRKVNPHLPFSAPDEINPNGPAWGLRDLALDVTQAAGRPDAVPQHGATASFVAFGFLLARLLPVMAADAIGLATRRHWQRVRRIGQLLADHPVRSWPTVIVTRWKARRTRV